MRCDMSIISAVNIPKVLQTLGCFFVDCMCSITTHVECVGYRAILVSQYLTPLALNESTVAAHEGKSVLLLQRLAMKASFTGTELER